MFRAKTYNFMERLIIRLSAAIAILPFLSGCLSEHMAKEEAVYQRVVASFNNDTKANLVQQDNSLDLLSRWQGFEYVNIFCCRDDKYTLIEPAVKVSEVSSDGSSAIFSYRVPESWSSWVQNHSYGVTLFTTPCYPKEKDNKLYFNASLIRESIDTFVLPVYCEGEVSGNEPLNATFKHYYAYELLHISNDSDNPISFSLKGFKAEYSWYKTTGSICLDDGEFVINAPSTKIPSVLIFYITLWDKLSYHR